MSNYILHLETSTKVCSVALSKNGELIACQECNDETYKHSECLTLYIQKVLQQSKIDAKQLVAVSISAGPGSYTGLRIGTSAAKGLCYALDIPLIAISSLENIAVLARKKHTKQTICSLIDARRMEVFSAIYTADMNVLKNASSDILDETSYEQYEPFIAIGNGAQKMELHWKNRNIAFDPTVFSSAIGHVNIAYLKYQQQAFENIAYFEPTYIKEWQNK